MLKKEHFNCNQTTQKHAQNAQRKELSKIDKFILQRDCQLAIESPFRFIHEQPETNSVFSFIQSMRMLKGVKNGIALFVNYV